MQYITENESEDTEMHNTFKEICQKASENGWSAEQLEEALKAAGFTESDFSLVKELEPEEMASVTGGAGVFPGNPATCDHPLIDRTHKWLSRSIEDASGRHFHLIPQWTFVCKNCGQQWVSTTDDKFTFVEGWTGRIDGEMRPGMRIHITG